MERTCQWVCSQESPADLIVRIGESTFPLHKFMMVPKSGYIRKKVKECPDTTKSVTVDISELPVGADTFDKVSRFCYSPNFEMSVHDVAALRCAAEYLDMSEEDGDGGDSLERQTEAFLARAALRTLPGAVAVLRSCDGLGRAAEELGIVQRCVDAISLKVCNEALFPTQSPPEWWATELAALRPSSFQKVLSAMQSRHSTPTILATAFIIYVELSIPNLLSNHINTPTTPHATTTTTQRTLLESIISILPSNSDVQLPIAFLCHLLRSAIAISASTTSLNKLERQVSDILDQASTADLITIMLDASGERTGDLDSVRRIVTGFVERETASCGGVVFYGGGAGLCTPGLEKVARVVDALAAEIAPDEELTISKFVGIAGAVPKSARRVDDDLYRAVDIYLKAHPRLDEIEREKVCSVMDPLKLSYEARLHATQNKRLPLQAVLGAMYYDQLKLRSDDDGVATNTSPATVARGRAKADASLARENEALRTELARMRACMSQLERGRGSGSKPAALPQPKKATFLSSMSRALGRLNPFRSGSKDTSSINGGDAVGAIRGTKPRRRFSMS